GVKLLLHSWGTRAIVDKNQVQGVVFESKSGRQAILAKVIIDASGDGDLLASAGAEFDATIDVHLRIGNIGLVFEIGNVDTRRLTEFRESEPQRYADVIRNLITAGGVPWFSRTSIESVMAFDNSDHGFDLLSISALDVENLTLAEVAVRNRMLVTHDVLKRKMPGFENSFIMRTAPQLGTRGSRRLFGEYVLTEKDIKAGIVFEDSIAVCPAPLHNVSPEYPHGHIPYRCLVPREVENLLVAGRCYSSEDRGNDQLNLVPHCIAMGQAAGTAATLAIKKGARLRDVDYGMLQDCLGRQGVPLPNILKAKTNSQRNTQV
ncbi:MAG: FAD-dependent oxidoreductase, partial [Chloroflexi bacterium]|nr:FAD-dependent oxidoreductase [Chloroflexota bacterium]